MIDMTYNFRTCELALFFLLSVLLLQSIADRLYQTVCILLTYTFLLSYYTLNIMSHQNWAVNSVDKCPASIISCIKISEHV